MEELYLNFRFPVAGSMHIHLYSNYLYCIVRQAHNLGPQIPSDLKEKE